MLLIVLAPCWFFVYICDVFYCSCHVYVGSWCIYVMYLIVLAPCWFLVYVCDVFNCSCHVLVLGLCM